MSYVANNDNYINRNISSFTFIENDMARMVATIQSMDSTGKQVFHKYTLTKKDSGVKLPLELIKKQMDIAIENGNSEFEALRMALNGSCYEIEFS